MDQSLMQQLITLRPPTLPWWGILPSDDRIAIQRVRPMHSELWPRILGLILVKPLVISHPLHHKLNILVPDFVLNNLVWSSGTLQRHFQALKIYLRGGVRYFRNLAVLQKLGHRLLGQLTIADLGQWLATLTDLWPTFDQDVTDLWPTLDQPLTNMLVKS